MDEPTTPQSEAEPGLPLPGYRAQSLPNLALVTEGKFIEERLLRYIDRVCAVCSAPGSGMDKRFALDGRKHIQMGCMLVYRAVMNPGRAVLPEDHPPLLPSVVVFTDAPSASEAPPPEPSTVEPPLDPNAP